MPTFSEVLDLIQPKQVGRYWFVGTSPPQGPRIFGGQVLSQSLMAANATVPNVLTAHSLHAYFLRPGNPNEPIEFEVDPIRDGRSFSTRRVVARQNQQAIFNTAISYHVQEQGLEHSLTMPRVDPPDFETAARHREPAETAYMLDIFGIERQRLIGHEEHAQEPHLRNWFRAHGELRDDPRLHQVALALLSDFSLLSTVFLPVAGRRWQTDFMFASLDHAMWFHGPVNVSRPVLYDCESPWAGNGRGFTRGQLWSECGRPLASVAQEVLVRAKGGVNDK